MKKKLSAHAVAIVVSFSASLFLVAAQAAEILQRPAPVDLMSLLDDGPISVSGEMEVFIHLEMPSVAEFAANEVAAGRPVPSPARQRAHAAKVDAQQAGMRGTLASYGARELSTLRVGANGFRVKVDASRLTEIRNLAGVRALGRVEYHVPNLTRSVPWTGVDAVHAAGIDGAGVSIGVIDTGIDYTHANLGGSGNPADYAANDPDVVEPGTFPTAKVVGGFDFVGTIYNADSSDPAINTPVPDDDPLDENGHGSHVSGIAAGFGVPGNIGPGVAPAAELYALKVFGQSGSTNVTSDAIEWAMDPNGDGDTSDHLDVINMSLGSGFGDPNSPSAVASQNAVDIGMIVVASAGNDGDIPYITGSPAVAPDVTSVASSLSGGDTLGVATTGDVADTHEAVEGTSPVRLADGVVVATLLQPTDAANIEGCSAIADDLSGAIALLRRGTCTFNLKFINAQDAGAVGVVVWNDGASPSRIAPIVMGAVTNGTVPGVMVSFFSGDTLSTSLAGSGSISAELNESIMTATIFGDTISGFSSRGPGHGNSQFKPDVTAPGDAITSTLIASGDGPLTIGGTSMAAPHVAGLSALLRQAHGDSHKVGPRAIQALIQNSTVTAVPDGTVGPPHALARQGTGVMRADRAISLTSYADPGGVSFGRINPSRHFTSKRHVRVRDLSDRGDHGKKFHGHHGKKLRTFSVTHVPNQTFPGVTVSCPSIVRVSPKSHSGFHIRLTMDPTVGPFDDAFHSQTEVDGWCILDDGTDELRVGYLAVVDPASKMIVHRAKDGVNVRNIRGNVGFAEGFTLAGKGGELLDGTPNAIAKFGFRTNSFAAAGDLVEFGIATERPWESLAVYEYDILVDVNEDGITDFALVMADFFGDGQPITAIFPQGAALFTTGADLNDATAVMTFIGAQDSPFGFLGFLPPGDTDFDYTLITFDLRDLSFDVQEGSVDLNDEIVPGLNSFGLFPGTDVDVSTSGKGKMLWLFQNNNARFGRQADTVFIHHHHH